MFGLLATAAAAFLLTMRVSALNPFAAALRNLQLTANQQLYIAALKDPSVPLVVCTGPAGTGKTALTVLHALSELRRKHTTRFVLTRPTVLIDSEDFGALPGNIYDKTAPLFKHIQEIAADADGCVAEAHNILKQKSIDVVPLEYLRGLTFQDSWILADEMQNSTPRQMQALLTRMGQNAKLVVCGDTEQSDLNGPNGLHDFVTRLSRAHDSVNEGGQTFCEDGISLESIQMIQMTDEDVKRSALVKMLLGLYH
jgi:phosphate starvation-inducible PhoH-like protein